MVMLRADKWRSLSQWAERLPFWQSLVLLPPLSPLILIPAAFVWPRTIACSLFVLIATYVYCLYIGFLTFPQVAALAGKLYLATMGLTLFSILESRLEKWVEK